MNHTGVASPGRRRQASRNRSRTLVVVAIPSQSMSLASDRVQRPVHLRVEVAPEEVPALREARDPERRRLSREGVVAPDHEVRRRKVFLGGAGLLPIDGEVVRLDVDALEGPPDRPVSRHGQAVRAERLTLSPQVKPRDRLARRFGPLGHAAPVAASTRGQDGRQHDRGRDRPHRPRSIAPHRFPRASSGYLAGMDRYQELIDKRDREGLTDDEATELGRLMAERRGESYQGDADDPPPDVELRRRSVPEEEIEEELAEGGQGTPAA